MTGRFGPTLVRRLFFSIMFVYAATWVALLLQTFAHTFTDKIPMMAAVLKRESRTLNGFTNLPEATAFMAAISRKYDNINNKNAPYLTELWTRDNQRVFFDKKQFAYAPLVVDPQSITTRLINGKNYHVFRHDGMRWSLRIAKPIESPAEVMQWYGYKLSLNMWLILPCLMLPLWFGITRGLRPLRLLVTLIAGRDAEDLSPLHFDAKYGELKPVAAALDSLLLRLRAKILREQAFVQDAAHELCTPMAVISAQVHVLAKAATIPEKQEARQHLDHAIARAAHLIRQLLALARVDRMRAQESQMQDVAQQVRLDLEQMAPAALARQVTLSLEAPPSLLHCLERNTFQSILHNLLDNAIRYGHVGGTVQVKLTKEANHLLLIVTDDGPGISAAEQELVFERFYRGTGHAASGSGLGLAIVLQAAKRLGASVKLSNGALGKGCQFTVTIPIEAMNPAPNQASPWFWRQLSAAAIKQRFGATLMRRLFFAILISNALIWLSLTIQDTIQLNSSQRQFMPIRVDKAGRTLDRFTTATEAVAYMVGLSHIYGGKGPYPNLIELRGNDNKRIYSSGGQLPPSGLTHSADDPQPVTQVVLNGFNYDLYSHHGMRWSVHIARPGIPLWDRIKMNATDPDFNEGILLSLLIQLLAIWFAVSRGLLPLRTLSNRLAGRETENLAPLNLDAKYGELKPLVAALDSLLLRLRSKVEREQAFVQDAAHELDIPMTIIAAQIQVLSNATSAAEKQDAEQHINHAIARASHVIQQLLELARVDGMRAQDSQTLDVTQLLRYDLAQIVPAAMSRQIEIALEAPDTLPHRLERTTFQSLLHPLLDNAIRYGHKGGAVVVKLQKHGDSLLLTVADDGPGIAAAEQALVFERFYRGAGHEAFGSGLGLAIVRQAALRLGATVELENGIGGKGCRFTVRIPEGKSQRPG
jgi:signal transduction histidine kinase